MAPEYRQRVVAVLSELAERITDIGLPSRHPWFGVGLTGITPLDLERLTRRLQEAYSEGERLIGSMAAVTDAIYSQASPSISAFHASRSLAERVASCPDGLSAAALADPVWENCLADIGAVVTAGEDLQKLSVQLEANFQPAAWEADPEPLLRAFQRLPSSFSRSGYATVAVLDGLVPRLLAAAGSLKMMLGVDASPTLGSIGRLVKIGERVADAPDASPDAFVAAIWDRGLDQASDLAEAVATYKEIRSHLSEKFSDHAWDIDLTATRTAVAIHGNRALKFLSGDWRKAKALLKTLTTETSADEIVRLLDLLMKAKIARTSIRKVTASDARRLVPIGSANDQTRNPWKISFCG